MRRLVLPPEAAKAIRAHEAYFLPNECCGLLAGETGVVRFVYPLTNANPSPNSFTIDPREHFHSWRHASSNGWDLIGAYHSHPNGHGYPSKTDLALANEPEWIYLIVAGGEISGWVIAARIAEEVTIDPR